MREYVTRAVVLDKEVRNDVDARYSFFTERFGKIAARAKSSRKMLSKLAGHLEPGTLAAVRIVEQRGTQVVDALAVGRVGISLAHLAALNGLLPEWEPDAALWRELAGVAGSGGGMGSGAAARADFSWPKVLAILGWDPRGAVCVSCGAGGVVRGTRANDADCAAGARSAALRFFLPRQEFFCASCAAASKFSPGELILI